MSSGAHAATGAAVVDDLGTDALRGLTGAEAAARRGRHGPNRWVVPRRVTFLRVLADEVTEPMMLLLAAIAVLYGVWGRFDDTVAVVVIIAAVVGVEVFAEFRAKSVIASLGELTAPTTPVVRDGSTLSVGVDDIVPGDLVPLAAGSRVPADLRLVETWGLRVDESTLTGEPVAAPKDAARVLSGETALAERANLVFAGTTVVAGRARGVVVATGTATELGTLTGLVVAARPPRTALQQAMRELAGSLATLAIAFSVLVPLIGVLSGRPWREMVLTGLTLAFATVPEELPIIVSLVLGLGAHRLSRRRGLVRRLRAAEALGLVTVLATDKTGTLTRNRMAVTRVEPAPGVDEDTLLGLGAACTETAPEPDGGWSGDPTDVAFLVAARDRGLPTPAEPVARFPFDPGRETMTVVLPAGASGTATVVTTGSPESVLARCAAPSPGTAGRVAALAARGLRVIAVASRPAAQVPATVGDAERDLVLAGLVALSDPPRPGAAEAVAAARRAGVRVVMVTGDHPACARAVAAEVGIDPDPVLTGRDLDGLDDATLAAAAASTPVFARVSPAHKLRLVTALQAGGEVVAVTGDGVNDAPALARADVGVAMGSSGTDVAREAAGLVLADDDVSTLTRALHEGRTLHGNLRKGVAYYLACKAALVATVAAGVLSGMAVPFTPIQIVVLEMFMDIAGSATFAAEPAERDAMTRPPRDPGARFLDRALLGDLAAGAAALFVAVGGLYLLTASQTVAFVAWLSGHLALAWVMRTERTPVLRAGLFANRFLPWWTVVTAVAVWVVMTVPVLRETLRLTLLTGPQWAAAVLVPVAAVAVLELRKAGRRRAATARPAA
ncbi:cation-transporting P-type ATPase [Pseudonocardia sp. ICBG1034]|uniref:cation-translocating P-type ATPase n=1 Tax=Pseudonocardia sp. ICBG1034 TaxID=2844381 RepID=UPI001CCB89AC|nr:cation-transporting P-type ATPase [Pseudonocardia sp. ICBG1034]